MLLMGLLRIVFYLFLKDSTFKAQRRLSLTSIFLDRSFPFLLSPSPLSLFPPQKGLTAVKKRDRERRDRGRGGGSGFHLLPELLVPELLAKRARGGLGLVGR